MPTQQMVIKDDTMNRSRALLAATLTASVLTANATPFQLGTSYAGLNYALFAYRENGIGKDLEPTALVGKLGHFIFDQLSVEGRFGLGVSDDTIKAGNGVDVTGDLDRMFGLYATGHFPLGEHASVYALIGFTDIRATFSTPGVSVSESDNGFTYGFGADIYMGSRFGINAEYTRYLDQTGYRFSATSIGATLHF